ncbi:hypothetical protein LJ754_09995 [Arthrobacter sp. zg-Y40]|uniref:hypothetical protein n=1 Tax=Arthrobacter sp. zg-Y40 TaxID=2886939 RepID=UPI001D15688E|nr:hypothetical protein [Arthrobacter sp. zg-Y40]MCC3279485.1 hypothetical protein [Arthrobacter sp. zg-Y40]
MTTIFRIDALRIQTSGGPVEYRFPENMTVLSGHVGVGKSTLFELIKFSLGGHGLLAGIVRSDVSAVAVEVSVGTSHYVLTRDIQPGRSNIVTVFDCDNKSFLQDHYVEKEEPALNTFLLQALGIPDDMRAASRSAGSTNQGARISFYDLFKYMYVSQADINEEIAGSADSYYQPKRKAVFEVLFALTNPELLELRSEVARTRGEWEKAKNDHSVVVQFLADSNTPTKDAAQKQLSAAKEQKRLAARELNSYQEAVVPVSDRETLTLRDLLGDSERSAAEARNYLRFLSQQRADFVRERSLIAQDIGRIRSMKLAGERLAQIEFVTCPRCMQSVRDRSAPIHTCRLCLQSEPVPATPRETDADTYEILHLRGQIDEIGGQIEALDADIQATRSSLESRERLLVELAIKIDKRTSERITPRLQGFADATGNLAIANTLSQELERSLEQWDRVDDLQSFADVLEAKKLELSISLQAAEQELATRHQEVFDELDRRFFAITAAIRIPGVATAKIDRRSYLPVLNGKRFDAFSPVGGVRTAIQIAYWVTLMAVALEREDTCYPAFLLIDSPRTSLNDDEDLSKALYRSIVDLVGVAGNRLQVIIGDNELPVENDGQYTEINFDYEHPTISSVKHPGRDSVTRIGDAD